VPIGVAGIVFLVVVGVLLPWGAVRSARRLDAGAALPRRQRFYVATLGQQLAMVALALWAAAANDIALFPVPLGRGRDALLAATLLALLLALLPWRWRATAENERARLLSLLPRTPPEKLLYTFLATVAGIGEELVYRGTMFALCERLTGNAWAAALLAATSFALGHAVQGAATSTLVGLLALAFQGLAATTGALYAGMTVHALFDVAVGLLANRILGGRIPPEPVSPAGVDRGANEASGDQHELPAGGGSGDGRPHA
jgi:membrane protease YdiL (CAAX protease family)